MCPRGGRLLGGEGGPLARHRIVAHCLLIEASRELVLVDTGFGTGDCVNPERIPAMGRRLVAPSLRESETALRQLEALGLDPNDVRHIVSTHLDGDHAGGLGDFPDAEVHISGTELAFALSGSLRSRTRYIAAQWAHGPKWVEYGPGGDSWFGFESIRLLPGLDAEIALIPLPGHSIGHCGVAVNTRDGWLLHCGDAFFLRGEIETPRRCPPALRLYENLNNHKRKGRFENLERLQELAREHGDEVTLICSHDPVMLAEAQDGLQN
jgi:glyoxylase-like metal-dependent hydrolase (beta-lactamase superfamily II)